MLREISQTHDELKWKISEIGRLQMELQGRNREPDDSVEKLKAIIASLEEENRNIKVYFLPWFIVVPFRKCFACFMCVFLLSLCVYFVCFAMYVYTFTSIFIQTLDLTNFSW